MRMPSRCERGLVAAFVIATAVAGIGRPAAAQMPDLAQMSGTPLPSGDLPAGTVSVRVVRGDLTNNVAGQPVELHGGAGDRRATTDESGRATFAGLPAGARVHVLAVVDGQRLESQNFDVPAEGGVKVMLVAGATAGAAASSAPAAAATAAAEPGTVVIGGQSRIAVELSDEGVDVYLLFDIANAKATPVTTAPIAFDVPAGAESLTVLEGSSPQVEVQGRRFVASGPFAPGITTLQMAYRLEHSADSLAISQKIPLEMSTVSLLARKFGGMQFRSPQAGAQREVTMQDGSPYYLATGQALTAGGTIDIELEGLPYHSRVPRFVALGLAVFILGAGAWLAANGPDARLVEARHKLEQKRDALLGHLVDVEQQRRTGQGDAARLAARREDLMAQLERVYAQLDHEPGSVRAGTPVSAASAPAAAGAPAAR